MMTMTITKLNPGSRWLAALVLSSSCAAASAVPIAGLVNTGDATFATDAADTNYAFGVTAGTATGTACASSTGLCGVVTAAASWPVGGGIWLENDATSRWLTPSGNQADSYDPASTGVYTWTLNFDLSGFDPSTASLAGRFAADNGATVSLNGGASFASAAGFNAWTAFAAGSGFVAGLNSIEFTVTNFAQTGGNPTGLRVEFLESSVTPVPEPEGYALALAALGLVGLSGARRRRG